MTTFNVKAASQGVYVISRGTAEFGRIINDNGRLATLFGAD